MSTSDTARPHRGRDVSLPRGTRRLDWDSEFFGFEIAAIEAPDLSRAALSELLDGLRGARFRLVYWPAAKRSEEVGRACGGNLVDRKLTFSREVGAPAPLDSRLHSAPKGPPSPGLVALALDSGVLSRFKVDPGFPVGAYEALYTRWIEVSTTRERAWEVLVGEGETGLLTLEGTAIGLVAVAEAARGQGLGTALVQGALTRCAEEGHARCDVVTQEENVAACRLYEQCGFQRVSCQPYFHFWFV